VWRDHTVDDDHSDSDEDSKLVLAFPPTCVSVIAGPSSKLFAWGGGGTVTGDSQCVLVVYF